MPPPMRLPVRRRARVLSAAASAVLAAAVLGAAAPPAFAEPTAEVSPRTVAPGDTITITVTCDPTGGPAPDTIEAGSQAFEHGTVRLSRVHGHDDPRNDDPGTAGTGHVAGTDSATDSGSGYGSGSVTGSDSVTDSATGSESVTGPDAVTGTGSDYGSGTATDPGSDTAPDSATGTDSLTSPYPEGDASVQGNSPATAGDPEAGLDPMAGQDSQRRPTYRGTARIASSLKSEGGADAAGKSKSSEWTVDGTCPAAPGGQGRPWSATFTVSRGDHHGKDDHGDHRGTASPGPRHGVHAGEGGAFTDSVPAMVAGGLLIAGALGAAVQRVLRRGARHR